MKALVRLLCLTSFHLVSGQTTTNRDWSKIPLLPLFPFNETVTGGSTKLLNRTDDPVIVYLSNEGTDSDTGVAAMVDLSITLVSRVHYNGDFEGPVYLKALVPDDPNITVQIVQQLYDAGVRVFVGPETSSQALALADWAEDIESPKSDVVFFTFFASSPKLGPRPNVVQLIPNDISLAAEILQARVFQPERTLISVIYDDGDYATGIYDIIRAKEGHRLVTSCRIDKSYTIQTANACVRKIANSSPPRNTMVILITSGRDTQLMMQAAYNVYAGEMHYEGNSNREVWWVSGDSVAYDNSLFDSAILQPTIWQGAQLVNLHAFVPSNNRLQPSDELTIKWWNDVAGFLPELKGDEAILSTDVSPIVLMAADAVSLIHLLSGTVVTGKGVNLDQMRLEILRLTPFVSAQSGPLRFTPNMERIQMPYIMVGLVKTSERPHLADGIWFVKALATSSDHTQRFAITSSGLTSIVPYRRTTADVGATGAGRMLTGILSSNDEPFKDKGIMPPQDNMYSAFDGSKGTTLDTKYKDSQPMNCNMPFPRRRRMQEMGFSKILLRSIVGDARLAFQPSSWGNRDCYRQIERSLWLSDLAEAGPEAVAPVCALSQTGYVLSVLDQNRKAKFSDFASCNQEQLVDAARSAYWIETTNNLTCADSESSYYHHVGHAAMWQENVCTTGLSHGSLGESYQKVDSSLFVTQGVAKSLINIPGLLREYIHLATDEQSATMKTSGGNALDEAKFSTETFMSHVRGEDWLCSCGFDKTEVVCSQMYRLIECPRNTDTTSAQDIEKGCCVLPHEDIGCDLWDPLVCSASIWTYIRNRDEQLALRDTMIAIHPNDVLSGYTFPASNFEPETTVPFPSNFGIKQCSNGASVIGYANPVTDLDLTEPLGEDDTEKNVTVDEGLPESGLHQMNVLPQIAAAIFAFVCFSF